MLLPRLLGLALALAKAANGLLTANETATDIHVATERLSFTISKENADLYDAYFDGVDLLGKRTSSTGRGYLICYCASSDVLSSSGEFAVGQAATSTYTLTTSQDLTNTSYVGIHLRDVQPTNQTFEYWWFVRDDGSNAIHQWARMTYWNDTVDYLTKFGEFRYLFRPQAGTGGAWTHLSTNAHTEAPLPSQADLDSEVKVQDATWVFPGSNSSWTGAVGEYFTKYIFADNYDYTHKAHGIYADGSQSNGTTVGAWQLLNTRDTYYGGPDRYDLFVDGAVYNKWSTSHYGARQSNITSGFDRTFGPQALYFNGNGALADLRDDAYSKANEAWNQAFYDFIGEKHVPTYVRSSQRGRLVGSVKVPANTVRAQAVLAQNGVDYAWNVQDQAAHQHWADVDLATGEFEVDRVAQGTYRLTIKFDGVFGDYVEDDVVVNANQTTRREGIAYTGDNHGEELWRIGIPDRTAGEFKHGFEPDLNHTSHIAQYRQVWQAYDFPTEFPHGINYTLGVSNLSDFNYIHWSSYGPSYTRPTIYRGNGINNATIHFHLSTPPQPNDTYTFTIRLAGAKGSSTPLSFDDNNIIVDWTLADVELWTFVNDDPRGDKWWIWQGFESSLGVRSGISGFNLETQWAWRGERFSEGWNRIVLQLPENSTSYVQYDALRLEVVRANATGITG